MAQNSSGASTEPLLPPSFTLHPPSFILHPSCPFGMQILVCFVSSVHWNELFASVSENRNFRWWREWSDQQFWSGSDEFSFGLQGEWLGRVRESRIIPREFRGWICQELSKGLWDPEFLCCFPGVHIVPSSHLQALYPCFNPDGGRKTPFLQSCSSLHVSQQRDLWSHSTRIVPWSNAMLFLQRGAASSGRDWTAGILCWNEGIWGEVIPQEMPGCGGCGREEKQLDPVSSCLLWRLRIVCAALPGVVTIPDFLEFLPPLLIFFPLETGLFSWQ